jgi:hypothetical protein
VQLNHGATETAPELARSVPLNRAGPAIGMQRILGRKCTGPGPVRVLRDGSLKTTYGRVPTAGLWPLAPSPDTVGPMAATVDGLITGMRLLEPGFTVAGAPARTIGRLRTSGHPEIEEAIDRALKMAEFEAVALDWDGFAQARASSPLSSSRRRGRPTTR